MKSSTLREKASTLRARGGALGQRATQAADHAPGAYITGGSGRTRAQNRATARAIERTVTLACASQAALDEAGRLEARADWLDAAPARKATRERCAQQARTERSRVAALPLVNDPAASWHMTSAEWARIHKDYKAIGTRDGYRVRSAFLPASRGGGLADVFLTDRPVVQIGTATA